MDGYMVQGSLSMARGSLARIDDGRGMLLYVWDGGLWITQEGDSRDYYVKPGEWFRLGRNGVVLAYALRRSSVTVTAPAPSRYARRLTRLWASAFAPFSRPTTAAL